jgi:hypothetical protein
LAALQVDHCPLDRTTDQPMGDGNTFVIGNS